MRGWIVQRAQRVLHSTRQQSWQWMPSCWPTVFVRRISSFPTEATDGAHPALHNPWDPANRRIRPLPQEASQIDTYSRHVIQLLQELYRYQRPISLDLISHERCQVALERLYRENTDGAPKGKVWIHRGTPRSDRAHILLETMQLFEERMLRTRFGERQDYEWPAPTRDTYKLVLQLDSRTAGPTRIVERTLRVVRHMHYTLYQKHGLVEFKANPFHWNCVFHAWKECTDPNEKSDPALSLLLKLHRDPTVELADTAYLVVLQMCANEPTRWVEDLWNELKHESSLVSHYYSGFLQAFRTLPVGSRIFLFGDCLQRAIACGKINDVILREFLVHAKDQDLIAKHLGSYPISGLKPDQAVDLLLQSIPASWTEHANMRNAKGKNNNDLDGDSHCREREEANDWSPTNPIASSETLS